MQPFRHRADRAHHVGLLDIEIVLHRAVRHVARKHHKRRPAFRRFADAGQRIGQARAGMHADKREFAASPWHRRPPCSRHCIRAARRSSSTPDCDQRVRDLEIGGAEERQSSAARHSGRGPRRSRRRPWDCRSYLSRCLADCEKKLKHHNIIMHTGRLPGSPAGSAPAGVRTKLQT